ncbi:MAG: hypothetical protein KIPDCIKN_04358 [Haliscomenobacter sp.]|nr:hypothetical protein [Haliscomenobacter sp.]
MESQKPVTQGIRRHRNRGPRSVPPSQTAINSGGRRQQGVRGRFRGAAMAQESLQSAMRRFDSMLAHQASKVGPREAFAQSVWVYGAVTAIADNISEADFVVESNGNPAPDSELARFMQRPNRYDQQSTSAKYRRAYFIELLLSGAVITTLGSMTGIKPGSLRVFPRNRFTVIDAVDENGVLVPVKWSLMSRGGLKHYLPGDDAYHDALYNPFHDWEGLSPLQAATIGITNDISIGQFIDKFFRNDCSTGVVFTSDNPRFNQEQAEIAEEKFNDLNRGNENWFRAKFLGFGLKPNAIGQQFDAKAQQIIKSMTKEEIVTGVYKIPLEVFGSRDNNGSGVTIGSSSPEPAKETFIVTVAIPWSRRFDENFTNDIAWRFGTGLSGHHDWTKNPILERRRLERAKQAIELIDRGVPLNVVIQWLDLRIDPQPHGNEFWIADNKVPARFIVEAGPGGLAASSSKKSRESVEGWIKQIMETAATQRASDAAAATVRRNGSPALLTAERLGLTQEQVNRLRCAEIMEDA